jgi:hypothetical protein
VLCRRDDAVLHAHIFAAREHFGGGAAMMRSDCVQNETLGSFAGSLALERSPRWQITP